MPVLWIISASVCAVALVESFAHREEAVKFTTRVGTALKISELIAVLALVDLAIYSGSVAARMSGWALAHGQLAPAFWGGWFRWGY